MPIRHRIPLISATLNLVVLLFLISAAQAGVPVPTDRYVAPTGNDTSNFCEDSANPCQTIERAVTISGADDTIHLAAGTYRETDISIGRDTTIIGNDAADTIIDADIDSDGTGDGLIFEMASPVNDITFSLTKVTLQHGKHSDPGGAIFCDTSPGDPFSLIITESILKGNTSTDVGGAIYAYGCIMSISKSELRDNVAESDGGAIFMTDASALTVTECIFHANKAYEGGALQNDSGELTIDHSTFTENTSQSGCCGVLRHDGGLLTVDATSFSRNESATNSGVLEARSDAIIRGSTFSENFSEDDGGAMLVGNNSTVSLINCTLSGNETNGHGGAIRVNTATLNLHNVTMTDNTADRDGASGKEGGALAIDVASSLPGAVVHVENSIIAGNHVFDLEDECFLGALGTLESGGYNIFGAASASCDPSLDATDQLGIDVATVLSPTLASNGGPTLTHTLVANSPAIDNGAPELEGGCQDQTDTALSEDQRGFERPVNVRCDVGAVEAGTCGDGSIDFDEECDEAAQNSDTSADSCRTSCMLPSCGDGVTDSGEACDDGNDVDGDGCTACTLDNEPIDDSEANGADGGSCALTPTPNDSSPTVVSLLLILPMLLMVRRKSSCKAC